WAPTHEPLPPTTSAPATQRPSWNPTHRGLENVDITRQESTHVHRGRETTQNHRPGAILALNRALFEPALHALLALAMDVLAPAWPTPLRRIRCARGGALGSRGRYGEQDTVFRGLQEDLRTSREQGQDVSGRSVDQGVRIRRLPGRPAHSPVADRPGRRVHTGNAHRVEGRSRHSRQRYLVSARALRRAARRSGVFFRVRRRHAPTRTGPAAKVDPGLHRGSRTDRDGAAGTDRDDVGPFVGEGGPVRGARRQRVGVALSGVLPVRRALARVSCGGFHPLPRPTRRRPPRCSERVGEHDGSCPDRAPAGGAKTGQVRRTGFSCYGNATFVARISHRACFFGLPRNTVWWMANKRPLGP